MTTLSSRTLPSCTRSRSVLIGPAGHQAPLYSSRKARFPASTDGPGRIRRLNFRLLCHLIKQPGAVLMQAVLAYNWCIAPLKSCTASAHISEPLIQHPARVIQCPSVCNDTVPGLSSEPSMTIHNLLLHLRLFFEASGTSGVMSAGCLSPHAFILDCA